MTGMDPGATTAAVEQGADRLEQAADKLYEATRRYEKAEERWDRKRLLFYAELYQKNEGKVPGEEVRLGLALRAFKDDPVYLEFVAARAESAALDKRYRALAAAVSARQSLLKVIGPLG